MIGITPVVSGHHNTMGQSKSTDNYRHQDDGHGTEMLKGLRRAYENQMLCDITLKADKYEIKAHKVVLVAYSNYFEAMFDFSMRDSSKGPCDEVSVPNVSGPILQILVDFAYSGELMISADNVQEILVAADFLRIPTVLKGCCEFLLTHIEVSNCLSIANIASRMGDTGLYRKAVEYCVEHFMKITKEQDFLECPTQILLEIAKDDSLNFMEGTTIPSPEKQEVAICNAMMGHIRHDIEGRKTYLPDLLSVLRLPLLPEKEFKKLQKTAVELGVEEECEKLFKRAHKMHSPKRVYKDSLPLWAKPREGAYIEYMWGPVYASGFVLPEVKKFNHTFQSKHLYVKGMKLWVRQWDGRPVIGGMEITYSNGIYETHGEWTKQEHSFMCREEEKITKVKVQSGWMIDCLTFYTSQGRKLGPYGGPGGGVRPDDEPPRKCKGFLAGMKGGIVDSQGSLAITSLAFVWAYCPHIRV